MKPKTGLKINDQIIPWSFVYQVNKLCNGDWDDTIDCFWKARHAVGTSGIHKYIKAGFKLRNGIAYMRLPSKERESGKMDSLRQWFDTLYDRKRVPVAECASLVNMLVGRFDCVKA